MATRYAGKLLALLGARVARSSPAPGSGESAVFEAWLDSGKALGPFEDADILLTEAAGERGSVVTVLIEPFGEGPYESYACADLVAFALSGWCSISGLQGRPPLTPSLPLPS